jgi:hypothetical protein
MNKSITLALTVLAGASCAHLQTLDPQLKTDWNRSLYYARANVDAGNYFAAAKVLDEFERLHPGTHEAREIAFWKAAYMVDPANQLGSLSGGIAALDAYLADSSTSWYKTEATVLRRTAAVAEGIMNQARAAAPDTTPVTTVPDTVVVVSRSRDEQIAALRDQLAKSKDELAKVSAELERIKKRLANPSN